MLHLKSKPAVFMYGAIWMIIISLIAPKVPALKKAIAQEHREQYRKLSR
jgi:hypothetical protein